MRYSYVALPGIMIIYKKNQIGSRPR